MEDSVLFDSGGHLQIREHGKTPVVVPFPVCLAIKNGSELFEMCPDFVLNIEGSWVFIRTGSPLPAGTPLLMHFYIPPETKLLAEVWGTVAPTVAAGMLIRFTRFSQGGLRRLERYAKGERPLVDRTA